MGVLVVVANTCVNCSTAFPLKRREAQWMPAHMLSLPPAHGAFHLEDLVKLLADGVCSVSRDRAALAITMLANNTSPRQLHRCTVKHRVSFLVITSRNRRFSAARHADGSRCSETSSPQVFFPSHCAHDHAALLCTLPWHAIPHQTTSIFSPQQYWPRVAVVHACFMLIAECCLIVLVPILRWSRGTLEAHGTKIQAALAGWSCNLYHLCRVSN